jgi:hypothetical protein
MAKAKIRNVCFDGTLQNPENRKFMIDGIRTEAQEKLGNLCGYVNASLGAFFAASRDASSIFISLSLEPKEQWRGGIYENSNYIRFMLDDDGTLELHNAQYTFSQAGVRFRKQHAKSMADALNRIEKFVEAAKQSIAQGGA